MEKVLERDQKLSQLDDRADALQVGVSRILYSKPNIFAIYSKTLSITLFSSDYSKAISLEYLYISYSTLFDIVEDYRDLLIVKEFFLTQ